MASIGDGDGQVNKEWFNRWLWHKQNSQNHQLPAAVAWDGRCSIQESIEIIFIIVVETTAKSVETMETLWRLPGQQVHICWWWQEWTLVSHQRPTDRPDLPTDTKDHRLLGLDYRCSSSLDAYRGWWLSRGGGSKQTNWSHRGIPGGWIRYSDIVLCCGGMLKRWIMETSVFCLNLVIAEDPQYLSTCLLFRFFSREIVGVTRTLFGIVNYMHRILVVMWESRCSI